MEQEDIQVVAFEIILHGTARTTIHDAFKNMREENMKLHLNS